MEDRIYNTLATAKSGYIIAPAGCGKTEAIVKCVKNFTVGKQLILTHTHAGVSALKKRFRKHELSLEKYHLDTISGWALKWVSHYPKLSNYSGCLPIPNNGDWASIYVSAARLLQQQFVKEVIQFSYSGILVDEYQDCTVPMHNLIVELRNILPCRILGDPLQAIFSISNNDPLICWNEAIKCFSPKLGEMLTPYRWINVQNRTLGDWLINVRQEFEEGKRPNFKDSPIKIERHDINVRTSKLQSLVRKLNGSICVIGSKHGRHDGKLVSALANVGFHLAEPNDLPDLRKFLIALSEPVDAIKKGNIASEFILKSFSGVTSSKKFIEDILMGKLRQKPALSERKRLYNLHPNGYTHQLLLDLIDYLLASTMRCKRTETIWTLKRVLEKIGEESSDLIKLFSEEIMLRKVVGKGVAKKCIGSTLLLKGLEFDHCIILFKAEDNGWKDLKDLYVAITRGCKTIHLFES